MILGSYTPSSLEIFASSFPKAVGEALVAQALRQGHTASEMWDDVGLLEGLGQIWMLKAARSVAKACPAHPFGPANRRRLGSQDVRDPSGKRKASLRVHLDGDSAMPLPRFRFERWPLGPRLNLESATVAF